MFRNTTRDNVIKKRNFLKYKKALDEFNSPFVKDIEKYTHSVRCIFTDFDCSSEYYFKF